MSGEDVRALRLSLGCTYKQFAAAMGVWVSTVQLWEKHGAGAPASKLLCMVKEHPEAWAWLSCRAGS